MYEGVYTAIVTPFKSGESLDEAAYARLIELQLAAGVDGIVPVGTTGEAPTLSQAEQARLIALTVELCRGRAAVIAGAGSNSTAHAVELTRQAKAAGADAVLQVTPYYNRPNQQGLLRHFWTIADAGLPVVVYNVPGRTGCEIAVDTLAELARHPNIAAVKEAGGRVERVSAILAACDLTVLSGDDALTLPMMKVGAQGIISVASNVIPAGVARLAHAALEGCWEEAEGLHRKYEPLFKALFIDSNPIPVKAALAMLGQVEEIYRLPLCPMSAELKAQLRGVIEKMGLF